MSTHMHRVVKLLGLGGMLTLGSMALGGTASAYNPTGATWTRSDLPVGYTVNRSLDDQVSDAEALAAIQQGYDVWTELECSQMAWRYEGRTDNTAWGSADGENVVSWRNSGWDDSAAALAITASIFDFQERLQDTDIKYNGVNHSWGALASSSRGERRTDIASVTAHEVGHALGLDHTNVSGSTMWPSTGPGDVSGRTLGADDIQGACDLYPNGGEVPDPIPDDPGGGGGGPGAAMFGDDCSAQACASGLFCVNDGQALYCSESCSPGSDTCPDGYYCAQLSGGSGACARGEPPAPPTAGFNEPCGDGVGCEQGLFCINDGENFYCSQPCVGGMCPDGFFCASLRSGGTVCARGDGPNGGEPLPGFGEPCTEERGLCGDDLFCLSDPLNTNEAGQTVPYCTNDCPGGTCPADYRCVDVPNGRACQKIPSAGQRQMGDACWVNPERPWEVPICGDGLVCVEYVISGREVVDPGYCTRNCDAENCCPDGWGCLEVITFGQCAPDRQDTIGYECVGERPPLEMPDDPESPEGPGGGDGGVGPDGVVRADGGGGGGGCTTAAGTQQGVWWWAALGLLTVRRRRRKAHT
ncbi:MAG: matrixin family metalloprotease [Bradymonadia bacterium]